MSWPKIYPSLTRIYIGHAKNINRFRIKLITMIDLKYMQALSNFHNCPSASKNHQRLAPEVCHSPFVSQIYQAQSIFSDNTHLLSKTTIIRPSNKRRDRAERCYSLDHRWRSLNNHQYFLKTPIRISTYRSISIRRAINSSWSFCLNRTTGIPIDTRAELTQRHRSDESDDPTRIDGGVISDLKAILLGCSCYDFSY